TGTSCASCERWRTARTRSRRSTDGAGNSDAATGAYVHDGTVDPVDPPDRPAPHRRDRRVGPALLLLTAQCGAHALRLAWRAGRVRGSRERAMARGRHDRNGRSVRMAVD